MTELFAHLAVCAVFGSLSTGLICLLRPVIGRIFRSTGMYRLWILLLFLWVLPLRFTAPFPTEQSPPVYTTVLNTVVSHLYSEEIPFSEKETAELQTAVSPFSPVLSEDSREERISPVPFLTFFWCGGAILSFSVQIILYQRFCRELGVSVLCVEKGEGFPFSIYHSRSVDSPMLVGLFSPRLYLPIREYTKEEMQCILLHEYNHRKRRDIPWKWFAMTVRCIHWWNPLVHLAVRQFHEECEISCDCLAAAGMDSEMRKVYMRLLLDLAQTMCRRRDALSTGFFSGKRFLKRRLTMIQKEKNPRILFTILSGILLTCLSTGLVYGSGVFQDTILPDETKERELLPVKEAVPEEENDATPAVLPEVSVSDEKTAEETTSPAEETADQPILYKPAGVIGMPYGFFTAGNGEQMFHNGVDFLGSPESPIQSISSGVITYMGYDYSYGNMVIVQSGAYEIRYAHLADFAPGLKTGDSVHTMDLLGTMGMTGAVTGYHLHLEICMNGETVDPASLWEK